MISQKVEQLCRLIGKHADEKTPLNLSDVLFGFCNEYESPTDAVSAVLIRISVVNNFLFAQQTDVLGDEQKAATLRGNAMDLLTGININKHFPWIPDFLESLPISISKPMMPPGLIDMMALFDVSNDYFRPWTPLTTVTESACRVNHHHGCQLIQSPQRKIAWPNRQIISLRLRPRVTRPPTR